MWLGKCDVFFDGEIFKYEGQLNERNQPTGVGKAMNRHVDKVEGTWINGKAHGRCKELFLI